MIVSINQPAYLPWLGYFSRIYKSDIHVVLDHVQFEKNSMINRNKIRTKSGSQMLTIPVRSAGKFGDLAICDVEIANEQSKWAGKHWQAIQQNYSKAKYFDQHKSFLSEIYSKKWDYLNSLLRETNYYFLEQLGIKTKLIFSSELNINGKKEELVLNICKEFNAKKYISGPFGRDYLDRDAFDAAGIELDFHDYSHPEYKQVYKGFEKNMSVLDVLMNHGPDSLDIISRSD